MTCSELFVGVGMLPSVASLPSRPFLMSVFAGAAGGVGVRPIFGRPVR